MVRVFITFMVDITFMVSGTVMVDYYIYGWYSKPTGSWWLNWFAIYPGGVYEIMNIWQLLNEAG